MYSGEPSPAVLLAALGGEGDTIPASLLSVVAKSEFSDGGELAKHLLDDRESGGIGNTFDTCKWNDVSGEKPTWLEFTIAGGARRLTKFALKSANDVPGRDPKKWKLVGIRATDGARETLHAHDGDAWKGKRWHWVEFAVASASEFEKLRLEIDENHGDHCTQLGQVRFHGEPLYTQDEALEAAVKSPETLQLALTPARAATALRLLERGADVGAARDGLLADDAKQLRATHPDLWRRLLIYSTVEGSWSRRRRRRISCCRLSCSKSPKCA